MMSEETGSDAISPMPLVSGTSNNGGEVLAKILANYTHKEDIQLCMP